MAGGGSQTEQPVSEKLKNGLEAAAIELQGDGRSEGAGEQDVPAYVEWVREILEAFAIPKPVMAGHSLGAAIALAFAIKYPGLLSGIFPLAGVLKCPSIKRSWTG